MILDCIQKSTINNANPSRYPICLAPFGGNVGIGKTPDTRLDVNGTIRGNAIQMNSGGGVMQIASGIVSVAGTSGTVTFPFTFTNLPSVTTNILTGGPMASTVYSVNINNLTQNGFVYRKVYISVNTNGAGGGAEDWFSWIAIG